MKKLDFNQGWEVRCVTTDGTFEPVSVPHDAMISEPRTADSIGEGNIGFFAGYDYEYRKVIDVPAEDEGKKQILEFEGVYHNAEVFINGEKAAERPYGYSNFYADAGAFFRYGEKNEVQVRVRNSDQPNSRWYSGTGIYRPVWLWEGEGAYIPVNGVKIRTLDYETRKILVTVKTSAPGTVRMQLLKGEALNPAGLSDEERLISSFTKQADREGVQFCVRVRDAELWSPDAPNLYTCRILFGEDCVEETFGIRTLRWRPGEGMTINGERVILRGACIHHDNGILGACAYPEAEERRVRILMENGYNAIRSAHNPVSKTMLASCDRLGMLMMDEFVDCWYIHKTKYDYASLHSKWWQADLREMVDKDYNHPCVIMYSTGNEVAETSEKRGIELTGQMTEYLHDLDSTRPVTCGVNIFFNFLYSMGFGVYSDDKADKAVDSAKKAADGGKKKKPVGSEFYNTLACMLGDRFMKFGATLPPSDWKTRGGFANMDIAGYNYGIWRYRHDLKKYPRRLILGSETFCKDAYLFWEIARDNPNIIGDFVWAGMDYIGETGIGATEYRDYLLTEDESHMTGGNGRIDLLGKPRAEAAYTRVALERENGPLIGVLPVYEDEKLQLTGWQLSKAVESWSWRGCDGKEANVEVYARASEVEVLVNGVSAGRKKRAVNGCMYRFKVPYADGEITAVSYDENGAEIGRYSLKTAGEESALRVTPEEETVKAGGLSFIRLQYTDDEGIWQPQGIHHLTVSVDNGTLLGLGSANPYVQGNYTENTVRTYFGEAMAVVRAGSGGTVTVTVTDETGSHICGIPVETC
ncbi:MAG: DUF4982 domain-containing protein [Lachnospiraceae bacterium]|nr:DUF4982 domain-containing protein [Lachnospiraceae bacterium]